MDTRPKCCGRSKCWRRYDKYHSAMYSHPGDVVAVAVAVADHVAAKPKCCRGLKCWRRADPIHCDQYSHPN